uniref:Uncharacterized protein n=1 Tax=Plectus sambesii TaxID=2011161 RepID=A0A914VPK4_9BILA
MLLTKDGTGRLEQTSPGQGARVYIRAGDEKIRNGRGSSTHITVAFTSVTGAPTDQFSPPSPPPTVTDHMSDKMERPNERDNRQNNKWGLADGGPSF